MTETTRAKSAKKPADHKPADADLVKVEFQGAEFSVRAGSMSSLRVLDELERNQITTALRMILGDAAFEKYLEGNPDADVDDAGKLLQAIAEKAGVKNS